MYCEVYLKKRGLLPGTSCTTAIHGDNPLEEGLNIVFIARRQHQTGSVSCAATSNLTITSLPVESAFVEKKDYDALETRLHPTAVAWSEPEQAEIVTG